MFPPSCRLLIAVLISVLTYPYISNRFKEGRQLPMIVKPFRKADITERKTISVVRQGKCWYSRIDIDSCPTEKIVHWVFYLLFSSPILYIQIQTTAIWFLMQNINIPFYRYMQLVDGTPYTPLWSYTRSTSAKCLYENGTSTMLSFRSILWRQ